MYNIVPPIARAIPKILNIDDVIPSIQLKLDPTIVPITADVTGLALVGYLSV